jgi:hypothetical protein
MSSLDYRAVPAAPLLPWAAPATQRTRAAVRVLWAVPLRRRVAHCGRRRRRRAQDDCGNNWWGQGSPFPCHWRGQGRRACCCGCCHYWTIAWPRKKISTKKTNSRRYRPHRQPPHPRPAGWVAGGVNPAPPSRTRVDRRRSDRGAPSGGRGTPRCPPPKRVPNRCCLAIARVTGADGGRSGDGGGSVLFALLHCNSLHCMALHCMTMALFCLF